MWQEVGSAEDRQDCRLCIRKRFSLCVGSTGGVGGGVGHQDSDGEYGCLPVCGKGAVTCAVLKMAL